MSRLLALGAALVVLLAQPLAASAAEEDPTAPPVTVPDEEVTMEVVTANGSGCPVGTVAVAISPDNRAFTITYSDYLVQTGTGPLQENCQINMLVHAPGGYSYSVAQADYRGYASLAEGASGKLRSTYYFQGETPSAYTVHDLVGPLEDNWQITDEVAFEALVFAPCGVQRALNVNTRLTIAAGTSDPMLPSYLAMDSTDLSFSTKYYFTWMVCPEAEAEAAA